MALELPNLDDRTFDDLAEEGRSMIPNYAPSWTNHNPSDPGITLVELLAYFTELLTFRLDRISRESKLEFLRLLLGPDGMAGADLADAPTERVEEALKDAVLDLRTLRRAVTPEDYETLAKRASAAVARACCAPQTRLDDPHGLAEARRPGHVSVVVVPVPPGDGSSEDLDAVIDAVRGFLAPKCLLTTRLHVVGPRFLWVCLRIRLAAKVENPFQQVCAGAVSALERYFGPFRGDGPAGEGWPFGRSLPISEIFDVVERAEGVESVEDVHVSHLSCRGKDDFGDGSAVGIQIGEVSRVGIDTRLGVGAASGAGRLLRNGGGQLIGIALRPYELPRIAVRIEVPAPGRAHGGV